MSFLSALWAYIAGFLSLILSLLLSWFSLFIAPFKNPELLWIIVPIWLAWFFSEFFQEKKSTSFGNAVSNGIVPVWVAIDWTRFLVGTTGRFSWLLAVKFAICAIVFAYGLLIIIASIRVWRYAPFIARIREVTYVLLMFTPIIYGVVEATWMVFSCIILFFPVFYILIEYINWITPDPDIIKQDSGPQHQARYQQQKDEADDLFYDKYPPRNF
jgi:hypothetical protein